MDNNHDSIHRCSPLRKLAYLLKDNPITRIEETWTRTLTFLVVSSTRWRGDKNKQRGRRSDLEIVPISKYGYRSLEARREFGATSKLIPKFLPLLKHYTTNIPTFGCDIGSILSYITNV